MAFSLHVFQPNNDIRYAAAKALWNSLEFVCGNMENETERNYLMSQVCEATQASDVRVREVAMQSLVKIVSLYYDKLKPYMQVCKYRGAPRQHACQFLACSLRRAPFSGFVWSYPGVCAEG